MRWADRVGVIWVIGASCLLVASCAVSAGEPVPRIPLEESGGLSIQEAEATPTPLITEIKPAGKTSSANSDNLKTAPAASSPNDADNNLPVDSLVDPALSGAFIVTDKSAYQLDEPVIVTIGNQLDQAIHSRSTPDGCSTFTVERQDDERWTASGYCLVTGPEDTLNLAPHSSETREGFLGTTVQRETPAGAGQPVAPAVFEGDLSQLPTITPPQPGDPVSEIPRGFVPTPTQESVLAPNGDEPAGGPESGALIPGTYRIALTFSADDDLDRFSTVYSEVFTVFK